MLIFPISVSNLAYKMYTTVGWVVINYLINKEHMMYIGSKFDIKSKTICIKFHVMQYTCIKKISQLLGSAYPRSIVPYK